MKKQMPSEPIQFMFFALRKYLWLFIAATFFVLLVELIGGGSRYALQQLIDSANGYVSGEVMLKTVFIWTAIIPVARLLYALFLRVSGFIMHQLTIRARTGTARLLFEYLSDHSLAYFNDRFAGSLGSRVATVSQSIVRLLSQFLWELMEMKRYARQKMV